MNDLNSKYLECIDKYIELPLWRKITKALNTLCNTKGKIVFVDKSDLSPCLSGVGAYYKNRYGQVVDIKGSIPYWACLRNDLKHVPSTLGIHVGIKYLKANFPIKESIELYKKYRLLQSEWLIHSENPSKKEINRLYKLLVLK